MTPDTRARTLLVLGWATAVTFVVFAVWARFPVPYRDDWEWLAWLLSEPPSLRRLFIPHGQHLIPLARLLVWAQDVVEGMNGRLVFVAGLAAQAGIVAMFWREIGARWPDDVVTRRTAQGAALLTLCFAWQLQSVVFVAAVLFPLVQVFATLAFTATASAMTTAAPDRRRRLIVVGLLGSIGAMASTTNGIVVPATMAMMTVARRRTRIVGMAHAALAAGGAAAFVLGTRATETSSGLLAAVDLPTIAVYFFAFFAPFITAGHPLAGAAAGLLVVGVGVVTAVNVLRAGDAAPRLERFAVAMMVFVFVSAALVAVGRAPEYGAGQAAQSRYATLAVACWASLILAAMSLMHRGAAPPVLRRAGRLLVPVAVPGALVLVAVHLIAGVVWIAKTGNVKTAGLALMADVRDEMWIRSLHTSPAQVYEVAAGARARGDRTMSDPNVGRRIGLDPALANCGAVLSTSTTPDGLACRLTGHVPVDVDSGWVLDAAGIVIGLAGPAPLVDAPAPTPADVAAVVGRALASGRWPGADRWVGFAPADAPGPLVFVGLSGGRPACASAVVD